MAAQAGKPWCSPVRTPCTCVDDIVPLQSFHHWCRWIPPSACLSGRGQDEHICTRHGARCRHSLVHATTIANHIMMSRHRYHSSRMPTMKSRVAAEDVDEENHHLIRRKIKHAQPLKGDPYLARHCRRNIVGSPPRGVPMVVDCR